MRHSQRPNLEVSDGGVSQSNEVPCTPYFVRNLDSLKNDIVSIIKLINAWYDC